jgi:hypothetical protein
LQWNARLVRLVTQLMREEVSAVRPGGYGQLTGAVGDG